MAFLIYKEHHDRNWVRVRDVKLGNTIGFYVQQQIKRTGFTGILKWDASEQQLLATEGEEFAGGGHRLVIDLKPATDGNVSLYQLRHVWGWTIDSWTPIALRLRPLFVDAEVKNPKEFKQKFDLPSEKELGEGGGPVHEFLYLRHKGPGAQWYWGRVGMVNGALLWPEVLDHFVECIRAYGQKSASASG